MNNEQRPTQRPPLHTDESPFRWDGGRRGPVSDTDVTASEAHLLLDRVTGLAARTALGDGLSRNVVAQTLRELADAIEFQQCAEDMSPIVYPMA